MWSTEKSMAGALAFYGDHLLTGDGHAQKMWAGLRHVSLNQIVARVLTDMLRTGISKSR